MKKYLRLFFILFITSSSIAQQNYCNFEGIKFINFSWTAGPLDTLFPNPEPDSINSSPYCAKYIRDDDLWDNIKMYPYERLIDITPYANYTFQTPTIKMKLYTSAPPGTKMRLQLGQKDFSYPAGVHSEYVAVTKVQYAWEQIIFYFNQTPSGSTAPPDDIDKIVFFFNYNTTARDTIYFDDLTGPELLIADVPIHDNEQDFLIYQNIPNPAQETTVISFQVNTPGLVSLKLYDMIGAQVASLDQGELKPGTYSIPLETKNLSDGIYFYSIIKDGISRSMKMIISK